jgi:15-cis-phytoene synthase
MQEAYRHCEALVREADHDRFLADLFAPAERRPHLHALQAFNIEIARVGEIAREALTGEIRLQWWRDALAGRAHGEVRAHPVAAALIDTIARCALPGEPLQMLIDARGRDLYREPVRTLAELETYGRQTASTLFEHAGRILDPGARVSDVASAGGAAYALAALMRALPAHAVHGRIFIPLDLLQRHGVQPDEVTSGTAGAGLKAAIAELAKVARERLAEARRGWGSVSSSARPAFLPLALVAPLLDRIERNPDPFRPIELAPWRRQWILWRAARRGSF